VPLRAARRKAPTAAQLAAGRRAGALFEEHGRMVHALCRLLLRDRVEAEDATQQTFLSAYRSLLTGVEIEEPRAWLATIARNECFGRRRSRQHETVVLDDTASAGENVETAVEQREEVEALAAAISDLPRSQRDAVVLREFYGLSYAEVAAALGVSGPAVESLLFKGRRKLQAKLSSLRAAGAVAFPLTLRDSLGQMLPGFGGSSAAAVGGAKLVALPVYTKVAAVALLVAGGGATVVETTSHHSASRARRSSTAGPASSAQASVVRPSAVRLPPASATPATRPSAAHPRPVHDDPVAASDKRKKHDDVAAEPALERGNADHAHVSGIREAIGSQGHRKPAAAATNGRALGKQKKKEKHEKARKIPSGNRVAEAVSAGQGPGQGSQGNSGASNGNKGGGGNPGGGRSPASGN
jgi:RNA polymerase sigma factor (sigma-70 family)